MVDILPRNPPTRPREAAQSTSTPQPQELYQKNLSNCGEECVKAASKHNLRLSTVSLLMYMYIDVESNARDIGPRLDKWKGSFDKAVKGQQKNLISNKATLEEALKGATEFSKLPSNSKTLIVELLQSKFPASASRKGQCVINYENFIQCCVFVKMFSNKDLASSSA